MKTFIASVSVLIIVLALTACADNSSQKPFIDLNANDILSIYVHAIPPDETILLEDMETIEQIVDILRTVVVYQMSNGWRDRAGQSVTFTINKNTGDVVEVRPTGSFLIIDGQGYETEYQPSENLNRIANTLLDTPFGSLPIE